MRWRGDNGRAVTPAIAARPLRLWSLMRRPNLTLAASAVVYMTARVFDLNLASYPAGTTWCGVVETAELGGAGASVPPAKAGPAAA